MDALLDQQLIFKTLLPVLPKHWEWKSPISYPDPDDGRLVLFDYRGHRSLAMDDSVGVRFYKDNEVLVFWWTQSLTHYDRCRRLSLGDPDLQSKLADAVREAVTG